MKSTITIPANELAEIVKQHMAQLFPASKVDSVRITEAGAVIEVTTTPTPVRKPQSVSQYGDH